MSPGRVFAVPLRPREPGPEARLAELGLALPAPRPPAGRYQGWVRAGDLLFLSGHGFGNEPYMMRRRWDYFVRHLLGAEPPREFEFRGAAPQVSTSP